MATEKRNPVEFFGHTLADAEGGQITPEGFVHHLDEIFAAAALDPEIEVVICIRRGPDAALLGVKDGIVIQNTHDFREILEQIMKHLS